MHTMSSKTHPRTHTHIFSNTNIFFCYYYKLISKKNIKLKQILINFNHFKVNPFQFQKGHFLNMRSILPKLDKLDKILSKNSNITHLNMVSYL